MGITTGTTSFITDEYEKGLQFIKELTEEDQARLKSYDMAAIFELIDKTLYQFQDQRNKMVKYFQRYTGEKLPIYYREYPDYIDETEKTEIHNSFEEEIVDTKTSYLFSNPVIRRVEDDAMVETMDDELKVFDKTNVMPDFDAEMCKMASICGYGASMMYISKKPNQFERLMKLSPWETVFLKDTFGDIIFALRFWAEETIDNRTMYKMELYDDMNVIYIDAHMSYKVTGIQPHGFDIIPVFMAKNNEELRSDIDKVVDLIDAYDKGISDWCNEVIGVRNAKQYAKGAEWNKEEAEISNQTGLINIPEEGEVGYIYKEIQNDAFIKCYEKLEDNISRFSGTPDFTNLDRVGNLTNLGISFLYSKLDQRAGYFKRKYTSYLQDVYRCLEGSLIKRGKSFDHSVIDLLWTEQLPRNEKENSEVQKNLDGLVTTVTRLAKDPDIDNPEQEAENLAKEKEEMAKKESAAFNFGSGDETTLTEE